MIKAPFNFVPLSDQVVFPEWADQISHDVPFSDGISGTISVRLTAESPIFVRNGHSQEDHKANNEKFATFSRIGDKFFLPGTTVKGAIRNVLEILSFSKMDVDKNARFAQRDLTNTKLYPLINPTEQKRIHCGWLRKRGDEYEIIDCGHPYRIGQINIDEYLGCNLFEKEFSEKNREKLSDEQKNACYKYSLLEKQGYLDLLSDLKFSILDSGKRTVIVSPIGDITGTIVFTGQPNKWKIPRKDNKGKYYEFVFPSVDEPFSYSLSSDEFEQYKFIYSESPDWEFMNRAFFDKQGIPVFFRLDNTGTTIKDWGIAYLYKLPYNRSVYQSLPEEHQRTGHDLAECIFGYTNDKSKLSKDKHAIDKEKDETSLKGRVQFSPFMSDNAVPDSKSISLVLGGPKASYYPIYIDQESQGTQGKLGINRPYLTYNNEAHNKGGHPNGWKRYLLRNNIWEKKATDNVETVIHPILQGAIFKGKIRFHNLRPVELGALLSALTFHGNQEECRHQIGMAKPYGYGKIKLDILTEETTFNSVGSVSDDMLYDIQAYMAIFENYMNKALAKTWTLRPQVQELLTLTKYCVRSNNDFDYMALDMENRKNEFNEAKTDHFYLQKYSTIIGKSSIVPSIWIPWENARQEELRKQNLASIEKQNRIEKERKEAEQAAKKAEKAAEGLTFLEEKYEAGTYAGKYKIDEFKKLRSRLAEYLDKTIQSERIPEEQWNMLETCLIRLAGNPSRDEKKKKLWSVRTSPLWGFVEKVTSKEFADRLFETIQKLKKDVK